MMGGYFHFFPKNEEASLLSTWSSRQGGFQ